MVFKVKIAASGLLISLLSPSNNFPEGLSWCLREEMYAGETLKITASAIEQRNEKPSAISTYMKRSNIL
jgi:hypothetical protein